MLLFLEIVELIYAMISGYLFMSKARLVFFDKYQNFDYEKNTDKYLDIFKFLVIIGLFVFIQSWLIKDYFWLFGNMFFLFALDIIAYFLNPTIGFLELIKLQYKHWLFPINNGIVELLKYLLKK